jgi:DMSO/TMAO reductase YedYZ molybdopterin-dependent catalytic subunit
MESGLLKNWQLSFIATLLLGVSMLLAKLFFAAPLPPEMLFNVTGQVLGVPQVFNIVHSLPWGLDEYAKYVLFAFTVLAYLTAWFGLGLGFKFFKRQARAVLSLPVYALLSVLITGLLLMPLQQLGLFGLSANNFFYPPLAAHLWALGFGLIFALGLLLFSTLKKAGAVNQDRRATLRLMLGGATALSLFGTLGRSLLTSVAQAQEQVTSLLAKLVGLSPEVTPTKDHYQVSKNVFNPDVKEAGWQLKIMGLVDTEITLSLAEIKALPSVERSSTLTCISNKVGGDLIGNSVWTGVKLNDILAMAGVQTDANELILRAADNYSDSFPLDAAMRDATIVAYLQNGEVLTRDHGFPARILVPGIYGMKNVKWVSEIELSNSDYTGYWQSRGWSDSAIVQTMSRIDSGDASFLDDGQALIGGVSFAGLRGISKVEVSFDGGTNWQEAQVKPALNELSWNLWGFAWQAQKGSYKVLVRATDGLGDLQTSDKNPPLPDGATGYHELSVKVA